MKTGEITRESIRKVLEKTPRWQRLNAQGQDELVEKYFKRREILTDDDTRGQNAFPLVAQGFAEGGFVPLPIIIEAITED
ncbi:MAG: hypothetical protein NTW06_04020 [Candidatus Falkowbacteria bacterium]|nr:hypothetical protein [Candidatus Falkowbacteria bacterium]